MLPVSSYSSKYVLDKKDPTVSNRMKHFYKIHDTHLEHPHKLDHINDYDNNGHHPSSMKSSFDFNLGTPDTPDTPDTDRDALHSRFVKEYKSVKTTSRSIKYPFSDSVSKHIQDDLDFFEDIQREKISTRTNKGPVIELCVYYINTIAHKPFMEFMLYKSNDYYQKKERVLIALAYHMSINQKKRLVK